jgi:hypothetical protein
VHNDRRGNTSRKKWHAKGRRKTKIQEFINRNRANVENEMYDYTGNNCSHWNGNKRFKEQIGSYTRKTFNRFTAKDSYTWNITRNTESAAV